MFKLTKYFFFGSLCAMPLTLIKEFGDFKVYTMDVFLVPMFFTFCLGKVIYPNRRVQLVGTDIFLLILFVMIVISFILSGDVSASVPNMVDWIRYLIIYFVSRTLFENKVITGNQFENVLIWIGIVLLVVGLVQITTNSRFGLIGNFFGGGRGQGSSANLGGYNIVNRVSGTTANSNVYAMWLNLFCTLGIVRSFLRGKFIRFYLGIFLVAYVTISTLARGGTIAFFLFLIIFFLISHSRVLESRFLISSFFAIFVSIILGMVALIFIEFPFWDSIDALLTRLDQAKDNKSGAGAEGRFMLVKIGFDVLFTNIKVFFFGAGVDNFPGGYIIHNMWMRLLVEQGIFVLTSFLAFIYSFIKAIRKLRNRQNKIINTWVIYLPSILIPFGLVSSQVYHTAGSYNLFIPLFVIISFVVSIQSVVNSKASKQKNNLLRNL